MNRRLLGLCCPLSILMYSCLLFSRLPALVVSGCLCSSSRPFEFQSSSALLFAVHWGASFSYSHSDAQSQSLSRTPRYSHTRALSFSLSLRVPPSALKRGPGKNKVNTPPTPSSSVPLPSLSLVPRPDSAPSTLATRCMKVLWMDSDCRSGTLNPLVRGQTSPSSRTLLV